VLLECAIRPAHNADGCISVGKGGLCAHQLATFHPPPRLLHAAAVPGRAVTVGCHLEVGWITRGMHLQSETIMS
jgi:hypothetical protein